MSKVLNQKQVEEIEERINSILWERGQELREKGEEFDWRIRQHLRELDRIHIGINVSKWIVLLGSLIIIVSMILSVLIWVDFTFEEQLLYTSAGAFMIFLGFIITMPRIENKEHKTESQ